MSDPLLKLIAGLSPEKRAILSELLRPQPEPIAIIGMSCRFPGGANSPDAFWRLLASGVDAISEVPSDRWDIDAYYHPDSARPGKMNTRWGGFISEVDQFDAAYFGITPREAIWMDPQQRILLEVGVEALEAAGQTSDRLRASQGGVFIGICSNDYARYQFADQSLIDAYASTGGAHSLAANRLSYLLDLHGPSVALDTACSSSLAAVHLACQSLRNKECHLALAGGVNLILSPEATISFSRFGMMAPDGRCKTFDASADGFVRGEGCGIIVLKRLSDAMAGNDPILAVIRGSAVNQDGRSAGLTAPNGQAQQAVIRQALAHAGLSADRLTYLEAHGTGTSLGDPIEVEAFAAVVGKPKHASQSCALGSVKTNIGHLEAAAGIAGLMKVVLSLQHETIPPTLHVRRLNPHIPIAGTSLVIAAEGRPWPAGSERRYAGVSSFGFGGTNAHALLEEAPALTSGPSMDRPHLLPLSARSAVSLRVTVDAWKEWLADPNGPSIEDVCYTAAARRNHHPYRVSVVGRSRAELSRRLNAVIVPEAATVGPQHKVVFAFSGQGTQWAGVGRELMSTERAFREVVTQCDAITRSFANWSLVERLESGEGIEDTETAQPLLCALQIALAALWRSWGIEPAAVVGHSLGEIAAAQVAGVLDLREAMRLAVLRGRLMQRMHGHGAMAAVELSGHDAATALTAFAGQISIGALNGPTSTVLSGAIDAVELLVAELQQQGVRTKLLGVPYAFHSPTLQPLREELQRGLSDLAPRPSSIPIVSTLTGQWIEGTELDAAYWGRQLAEPVRFLSAIETLIASDHDVFVEVGAHPVLSPDITQSLKRMSRAGSVVPSLRRQRGDRETMLEGLGTLYGVSLPVTWSRVAPEGRCVELPAYRWDHKRLWLDQTLKAAAAISIRAGAEHHPLLSYELPPLARVAGLRVWHGTLDRERHAYLWDHRIQGIPLLAAAAYIEMGLATIDNVDALAITNIALQKSLVLPEDGGSTEVQVSVAPGASNESTFEIHSRPLAPQDADSNWTLHAAGTIGPSSSDDASAMNLPIDQIRSRCTEAHSGESFYQTVRDGGLEYGPAFQAIEQLWRRDGEALARLRRPADAASDVGRYRVHPALLDACLQVFAATPHVRGDETEDGSVYVPVSVECVRLHGDRPNVAWSHATLRSSSDSNRKTLTGDLRAYDEAGRLVADIRGLCVRRVDPAVFHSVRERPEDWLYEVRWLPQARLDDQTSRPAPDTAGNWLILSDADGIGSALAALLETDGERCVVVPTSATDLLDPSQPDTFRMFLQKSFSIDQRPWRGIVNLWALDQSSGLLDAQRRVCGAVLYVLQNAIRTGGRPSPRLWLVTRNSQIASATDRAVNVAQAPLWGMGRVVALEHPEIWGGMVDLDSSTSVQDAASLLLQEVLQPSGEDHLAFRDGQRLAARLLRATPAPFTAPVGFAPDGTYLITGGFGGLGLLVAKWMVERGAQQIALLGRSEPTAQARRAIEELERLGARVAIFRADVSRSAEVVEVIQAIDRDMPALRGVIHSAGALADGILLQQDWTRFETVMAAKVLGAWNLHEQTKNHALDCFVMFSSMAALLGSPGQSNYAAANAFMDALAHHRRAQSLAALSINWGAWSERGVAAERYGEQAVIRGMNVLSPEQGLELLERVWSHPVAQVGVARMQWETVLERLGARRQPPLLSELAREARAQAGRPTVTSARVQAQLRNASPAERLEILIDHITELVMRVMGHDPTQRPDPRRGLFELGMDSLMALELQNALQASLDYQLPATAAFDYPSIAALAGYIAQLFPAETAAVANHAPDEGSEELDTLLAEIDQLSDEEAKEALRGDR